jgi:hypothetical protein
MTKQPFGVLPDLPRVLPRPSSEPHAMQLGGG